MRRKLTALLSCLAVVLGAIPFQSLTVSAAEYTASAWGGIYYYENMGDHIMITGCSGVTSNIFPEEIEGLPVTALSKGGSTKDKDRNPTGLDDDNIFMIQLPNGITSIPDGWFAGCSKLRTVILPESITSIGAGAFEGCDNLCDILYGGDDAQWDAVTIGAANETLENAYVQTNHNLVSGEKTGFVDGEDNWSFTNVQMNAYILSDETLKLYLETSHPECLAYYQKRRDRWVGKEYKGACAGFALSSYMASVGALDPSAIYEGAETLHDIPFCEEAMEAVTYYFLQTLTDAFQQQSASDADDIYLKSGAFLSDMLQGNPVYLGFAVQQGMHAVVAYGVEYGEWEYNDTLYTGRILIYDNNDGDFVDESCIYFNGNFEGTYIPSYDSPATLADFFYNPSAVPYGIGNRTAYQSTYALGDVNTDKTVDASDAAEILIAAAAAGAGGDGGLNNGQVHAADVDADGEFNASDAALVLRYAAETGTGSTLTFDEFLTQ